MYFLCSLHSIFSGTVPITALTATNNPNDIQPFIEKNILKTGYEKAVKEFLDEKRKVIQSEQERTRPIDAVASRSNTHTMTLRSKGRLTNLLIPAEATEATSVNIVKSDKLPKFREPAYKSTSNSCGKMTLRSKGRLIIPAEATKTSSANAINKRYKFTEKTEGQPKSQYYLRSRMQVATENKLESRSPVFVPQFDKMKLRNKSRNQRLN